MKYKYVSLNEIKSMIENKECTFEKFEETIFYNNDIEKLQEENNLNIKIVSDANKATGLTVVIDVFRAFTVEPYLINNGVKK